MSNNKLYEIVEESSWQVVFVGTEKECDDYIENPDHNGIYIYRESKGANHDKTVNNYPDV